MQITVKAHFNKQTKDSKKELVQFYIKGDDEKRPELNSMTRSVVEISIDEADVSLTAEFTKSAKDAKKTVLEFVIKGDTSADHSYQFYKYAGDDVILSIAESQMTIEEYNGEQPGDGIEYTQHQDGTVDVDPNQLGLEDYEEEEVYGVEEEERYEEEIPGTEDQGDDPLPF